MILQHTKIQTLPKKARRSKRLQGCLYLAVSEPTLMISYLMPVHS